MLARFLPRDERFFDYFRDAARNAVAVARLLAEVIADPAHPELERKVRRLRELEHEGDEITHQVFNALNRTFVTPLDREDIQALASRLDDFVDDVEEVGRRLWLYRLGPTTEPARRLALILCEQAERLAAAIPLLADAKQHDALLRATVEINRLEDEADDVLNGALGALYDEATDVPSLVRAIRWGEIYGLLEDASDRGEDLANTLEGIVLKYG